MALPLATYPSQDLILGSLTPESSLITTTRDFQEKVTFHLCDKLGLPTPPHSVRWEGDHTEKELEEDQCGWSLGAGKGGTRWRGGREAGGAGLGALPGDGSLLPTELSPLWG